MSNPEMALFIEKEHLRDAEDNDYQLMEGLIQRRLKPSDSDKFQNNAFFLTTTPEMERYQGRLRRSSAIEGDLPTPCQSSPPVPIVQSPEESTVVNQSGIQSTDSQEPEPSAQRGPYTNAKLCKNAQREVQL
ncbi:hypothetical protein AAG570_012605 [Ranatra chinensis]|uniref:Uncharacterized protein n=1 Tax=Ranatra chinensis TaxID=642074 RepID=A0ABD0YEB9_9HEMI